MKPGPKEFAMSSYIHKFTEKQIILQSNDTVFKRGQHYYNDGAVTLLLQHNNTIIAQVDDEQEPYCTVISFHGEQIEKAQCSCPYNTDFCKHVIATLLSYLNAPEKIISVEPLLHELDKLPIVRYQDLIMLLIQENPQLYNTIMQKLKDHCQTFIVTKSTINTDTIRKQTNEAIHCLDGVPYWESEGEVLDGLREIIAKAQEFLEVNDGHNAIAVLQALTEEYIEEWDDGEFCEAYDDGFFIIELDEAWVEVLLATSLDKDAAAQLTQNMLFWQKSADHNDCDAAFKNALFILTDWKSPEMKKIFNGQYTQPRENPTYRTKSFARQMLTQLKKEKLLNKYEHLAYYEGLPYEYVYSFILRDRIDEAVSKAQQILSTAHDVLMIAQELQEANHTTQALIVGSHGLTFDKDKTALGDWLGHLADTHGDYSLARQAYLAAFNDAINLERYKNIIRLTNEEDKETQKSELLSLIKPNHHVSVKIDIYLYEKLFDEAIATAESETDSLYYYEDSIKKVMLAVMGYNPVWVIKEAHKQATAIILEGKAQKYDYAISWLTLVKKAYESSEDYQEWHLCLEDLRTTYKAKYKLIAMLSEAFQGDI